MWCVHGGALFAQRAWYTNEGGGSGQKSGSNLSDSYVFIGTPFLRCLFTAAAAREEGVGEAGDVNVKNLAITCTET